MCKGIIFAKNNLLLGSVNKITGYSVSEYPVRPKGKPTLIKNI